MANCVVSFDVDTISGVPMANAKLVIESKEGEGLRAQDGAVIWPDKFDIICDASGLATVTLKTGKYVLSVATSQGEVRRPFIVPDRVTATAAEILSVPEGAYELMTWPALQALVAATISPYASAAAGLVAAAEGAAFIAASDGQFVLVRKVGGSATFLSPEML